MPKVDKKKGRCKPENTKRDTRDRSVLRGTKNYYLYDYVGVTKYGQTRDLHRKHQPDCFIYFHVPNPHLPRNTGCTFQEYTEPPIGFGGYRGRININSTIVACLAKLGYHEPLVLRKLFGWMHEITFMHYDCNSETVAVNGLPYFTSNSPFLYQFYRMFYLLKDTATSGIKESDLQAEMRARTESLWGKMQHRPTVQSLVGENVIRHNNKNIMFKAYETPPVTYEEHKTFRKWTCKRCKHDNRTAHVGNICIGCKQTPLRYCQRYSLSFKNCQKNYTKADKRQEEEKEEKFDDPDFDPEEVTKEKIISEMRKQFQNNAKVITKWMSLDPSPSDEDGHWYFVALIPYDMETKTVNTIKKQLNLTNNNKNRKRIYRKIVIVEKCQFQMVIHFGLHKIPHLVLGRKALIKLIEQTQVDVVESHMSDKNHYFNLCDPESSIVLNKPGDNWNDTPPGSPVPQDDLKLEIHRRGEMLMNKFTNNKQLMNEFVDVASVDKRAVCAIQFGQNIQDGNSYKFNGDNKPGLFQHTLNVSDEMKEMLRDMIFLHHSFLEGALNGTIREDQGLPDPECINYNSDFYSQVKMRQMQQLFLTRVPEACTIQTGQTLPHLDSLNCPKRSRDHVVIFTLHIKDWAKLLGPKQFNRLVDMKVRTKNTYFNVLFYMRKHIQNAVDRIANRPILSDYAEEMIAIISRKKLENTVAIPKPKDTEKDASDAVTDDVSQARNSSKKKTRKRQRKKKKEQKSRNGYIDSIIDFTQLEYPATQDQLQAELGNAVTNIDYPLGKILVQKEGTCRNLLLGSVAGHFLRWCLKYEEFIVWGHVDEFIALAARSVNGALLICGVLKKLTLKDDVACVQALQKRQPGYLYLFLEDRMVNHGIRVPDPDTIGVSTNWNRWQVGNEKLFCLLGQGGIDACAKYISFMSDVMSHLRRNTKDEQHTRKRATLEATKEEKRELVCNLAARQKAGITDVPLGPVRGNFAIQLSSYLLATPPENADYAFLGRGKNGYYKTVKHWLGPEAWVAQKTNNEDGEKGRINHEHLLQLVEEERKQIETQILYYPKAMADQVNCCWSRENLIEKDTHGVDIIFLNQKGDKLATPPIRNCRGKTMQILLEGKWTTLSSYVNYNNIGCNAYNCKWSYKVESKDTTKCLRGEE